LSEGKDIALVCQALEVSEATFHRWRNQYGGMKANEGVTDHFKTNHLRSNQNQPVIWLSL